MHLIFFSSDFVKFYIFSQGKTMWMFVIDSVFHYQNFTFLSALLKPLGQSKPLFTGIVLVWSSFINIYNNIALFRIVAFAKKKKEENSLNGQTYFCSFWHGFKCVLYLHDIGLFYIYSEVFCKIRNFQVYFYYTKLAYFDKNHLKIFYSETTEPN